MTTSPSLPARRPAQRLALFLCLGAASFSVLSGCGNTSGSSAGVQASASSSPTTEPTSVPTSEPTSEATSSSATEPELITYAGGEAAGVTVHDRADAAQLRGSPRSFKRFVAATAQKLVASASCDGAFVGVTVDAVRTDGFAIGGVNECGGYAALWAEIDGTWQEIQGTQDSWDCGVLEKYSFPSELLLGAQTCFDYDGDQLEHDYEQA